MFKTVRSVGAEIATLAYLLPSFWREAIAGEDQAEVTYLPTYLPEVTYLLPSFWREAMAGEDQAEVKPTTREPSEAAKAAWSSERGNMIDQKNTWNCF